MSVNSVWGDGRQRFVVNKWREKENTLAEGETIARMDKLEAMRVFVSIVDRGSLTAAAKELDRSLPTVVRTLAELERSLGATLLRRTTRRMALTEEGRVYLERCRAILHDVREAEELVGERPGEPRGELRVTAPVLFGQMHVAPAVTAFVRRYAGVRVELVLLDRLVNLVEERMDLAVRIGRLADSSLVAKGVGEVRRVVCASPALLRSVGRVRRPEDLEGKPCVGFTSLGHDRWGFYERGRETSVRVEARMCVNHAGAAVEACAEGLGFGRFLSYQVEPAVRAGRLRVVLQPFEPPPAPVSLVYADARLVTSRLRALVDALEKSLRARGSLPA